MLERYQKKLGQSIKRSVLVYDSVDFLHHTFHRISLNRGGSYIDFPKWLKNKIATINSKNNDHMCFQYSEIVALNYQNIKNNPERITKTKTFIDQYDWKEINFPSNKKKLEKIWIK